MKKEVVFKILFTFGFGVIVVAVIGIIIWAILAKPPQPIPPPVVHSSSHSISSEESSSNSISNVQTQNERVKRKTINVPKKKKAIFDVGANYGDFAINQAMQNADLTIYAFEPNPELVDIIEEAATERGLKNIHVIEAAVSDYNGNATFYIDDLGDKGCSSLKKFQNGIEETWKGRKDLKVTREMNVQVIRLEDFMNANEIDQIEYLHVDAQGADLQVLKGLGNRLKDVKSGEAEAATNNDLALYKDQHTYEDIIEFLEENDFEIVEVKPNDCHGYFIPPEGCQVEDANEVNVYFKRSGN